MQLLRRPGALVECSSARCYERGGIRRRTLRGQEKILNRLLVHVGASEDQSLTTQDVECEVAARAEKARGMALFEPPQVAHMPLLTEWRSKTPSRTGSCPSGNDRFNKPQDLLNGHSPALTTGC
jgi:hypothetical protein